VACLALGLGLALMATGASRETIIAQMVGVIAIAVASLWVHDRP
jgi:hypothetical protein